MSLYAPHAETTQPPSTEELAERVAWRLGQELDLGAMGFPDAGNAPATFAHLLPPDAPELLVLARVPQTLRPLPPATYTIQVMAEVAHPRGRNYSPHRLLTEVHARVFAALNGWRPDSAAADAAHGGALMHSTVLVPFTLTTPASAASLDTQDDRYFSTAVWSVTLDRA